MDIVFVEKAILFLSLTLILVFLLTPSLYILNSISHSQAQVYYKY